MLAVFDWRNNFIITNSKIDKSPVIGVAWKDEVEFATIGKKYLKFWTINGANIIEKQA
jgi:hypothetical protein